MSRRTGAGLSRERVLDAGLNLVDREGVAALTMRRLGRELGVEAMSLYGYVDSKQDLLDGVLEKVYQEIPPEVHSEGPWYGRLRETALLFRQVLLRHPNTVGLVAARPVMSEGSLSMVESALVELRRNGLDLVRASQAVTVIVAYTVGHVASEVGDFVAQGDPDGPKFACSVDPSRLPNVSECWALGPLDRDTSFTLGLDFMVSGIRALVETSS